MERPNRDIPFDEAYENDELTDDYHAHVGVWLEDNTEGPVLYRPSYGRRSDTMRPTFATFTAMGEWVVYATTDYEDAISAVREATPHGPYNIALFIPPYLLEDDEMDFIEDHGQAVIHVLDEVKYPGDW